METTFMKEKVITFSVYGTFTITLTTGREIPQRTSFHADELNLRNVTSCRYGWSWRYPRLPEVGWLG